LEQKEGKRKGSSGNEIVDFAMRYEGARYVYAGDGPRAFDCSGFTMFVIQKTLGIDITHDMAVQYEMGSHVRRNGLQPGDLVFFKNTYQHGLSHTGIYIGDGQFIHAENESTGVRISDLDSDYYSSRWYGAARFT
jgi:cell wall-associated NlpC family hydrolase